MSNLKLVILHTIPMLSPAMSAHSQEIDCSDPQDQTSMNICAYRDWQEADRKLNEVWPVIRKRLRDTDAVLPEELKGAEAALLKSQRAWINYRDGTCEAEGFQARGGTLEPLIVSSCLVSLTRHRTEELEKISPQY